MSEAAIFNENPAFLNDNEGESARQVPDVPPAEDVEQVSENEGSPSIQPAAPFPTAHPETGLNETLLQLQLLRFLTRELPSEIFFHSSK